MIMRSMFVASVVYVVMTKLVVISAMTQVNITKLYNNFVVNAVINSSTYQEIVSNSTCSFTYSLSTKLIDLINVSIDRYWIIPDSPLQ